jgi:hypothetical protein
MSLTPRIELQDLRNDRFSRSFAAALSAVMVSAVVSVKALVRCATNCENSLHSGSRVVKVCGTHEVRRA